MKKGMISLLVLILCFSASQLPVRASDVSGLERPVPQRRSDSATSAPPVQITVLPEGKGVSLKWSSVVGAAAYQIKRSTSPAGPYKTVALIRDTTYTDSEIGSNSFSFYLISPVDASFLEQSRRPLPPQFESGETENTTDKISSPPIQTDKGLKPPVLSGLLVFTPLE